MPAGMAEEDSQLAGVGSQLAGVLVGVGSQLALVGMLEARGERTEKGIKQRGINGCREGGRMLLGHRGDEGRDDKKRWGRRLGRRHKYKKEGILKG